MCLLYRVRKEPRLPDTQVLNAALREAESLAVEYATKAYQLRDRVSEREKLRISANYGAVLYEMATGKRPFQGKSQISLASAMTTAQSTEIKACR